MPKLALFIALFLGILFTGLHQAYAACISSSNSGCPQAYPQSCGGGLCCTPNTSCSTASAPAADSQESNICDATDDSRCDSCMTDGNHVWTAIGCIDTTSPTGLLEKLLGIGIGIAGGISFLLILFGGMQILTSAGNPEQLNAGRELVSSAIIGLILVIFSIFLLKFIGVNIIGIPGFSQGGEFNPN